MIGIRAFRRNTLGRRVGEARISLTLNHNYAILGIHSMKVGNASVFEIPLSEWRKLISEAEGNLGQMSTADITNLPG